MPQLSSEHYSHTAHSSSSCSKRWNLINGASGSLAPCCTVMGGVITDSTGCASPHKRKPGFGPWWFYRNEQGTGPCPEKRLSSSGRERDQCPKLFALQQQQQQPEDVGLAWSRGWIVTQETKCEQSKLSIKTQKGQISAIIYGIGCGFKTYWIARAQKKCYTIYSHANFICLVML